MKDQHEKIKTYRDLTQQEIDLINEVKTIEAKVNGLVDMMSMLHVDNRSKNTVNFIGSDPFDQRCIDIAQTNIENGFMYLIKSIAKPERLSE